MSLMILPLVVAAAEAEPSAVRWDAKEVGRVATVTFVDGPGRTALDPVLDGVRRRLAEDHGITLLERPDCGASDIDALACLRSVDDTVGAVLQLGASIEFADRVVATVDCSTDDQRERLSGGPFLDDRSARAWGAGALAEALVERVRTCATMPGRIRTDRALPAGTIVALDGQRLGSLDADAFVVVASVAPGRRKFTFERSQWTFEPAWVDVVSGEEVTLMVQAQKERLRPRWAFLLTSGVLLAGGAALFAVRHDELSGSCVSFEGDCSTDETRDARGIDTDALGAGASALVAGGAGLGLAELLIPRREPWWLVSLIGLASASVAVVPWLF